MLGVLRQMVNRMRQRTPAAHVEGKSQAQHDAVSRDDEFVQRFDQLRDLGIYESHVYEITDDVYAISSD